MPNNGHDETNPNDLLLQMLEDAKEAKSPDPRADLAAASSPSSRQLLLDEIDSIISAQVDEVLCHPRIRRLQSAWSALRNLSVQIGSDRNVRLQFLNCSKDDLAKDFEEAVDVTVAGLYRRLCEPELSSDGAPPVSLIIADYLFDPNQQEIELLRQCAAVAADAHAPFVANASPRFFGFQEFRELAGAGDLSAIFEGPHRAAWSSFRDTEDARYVALCVPCNAPIPAPASHSFASRVAAVFARDGWFDGLVEVGDHVRPAEGSLTERQMSELATEGFIALRAGAGAIPSPFSANSAQRPRRCADTPEGRAAQLNSRAATSLSNVLKISRMAHYIEALARELDSERDADILEASLQAWLEALLPAAQVHIVSKDYLRYELEIPLTQDNAELSLGVAGRLPCLTCAPFSSSDGS